MTETQLTEINGRQLSPLERYLVRSPYAIVAVVARIKGEVTEKMLLEAVSKVQKRHQNLRFRIVDDDNIAWFTSEGLKEIPVKLVPRESDNHCIKIYHDECKIPFDFDKRPAIRFILVKSPGISELVIFCHHVICDGLSLAYLARDLMIHLGDPTREVEVLPDPVPVDLGNLPEDISINAIVKFFINRMNKKWKKDQIFFDQEDYQNLNEAYWSNFKHQMISIELSDDETSKLVDRCRKEGVTVNSALTAAIVGAQCIIQGDKPYHSSIGIAGSMRDPLPVPAGESMGFFAGAVTLKHKYNRNAGFWDNARKFHQKVKPMYNNKNLFNDPVVWCYLEPGILESLCFKMIGILVPSSASRYEKLSTFGKQKDIISSLLKRENLDSLDNTVMGTAVTNLTRMDFPEKYGNLELDRLIMNPGGAFPLTLVNLVLGAVTCSGKLSLLIEYSENRFNTETIAKIKDKALELLFN